jgi:hypothetical protein
MEQFHNVPFNGSLKLDFPTLAPDKNGNPVVWSVVHKNANSGLMQANNFT